MCLFVSCTVAQDALQWPVAGGTVVSSPSTSERGCPSSLTPALSLQGEGMVWSTPS